MYVLCRDLKGNKEFAILMSTGKSFHQWRVSNGKELVTFILPGIPRIDEYIISISFFFLNQVVISVTMAFFW